MTSTICLKIKISKICKLFIKQYSYKISGCAAKLSIVYWVSWYGDNNCLINIK